MLGSYEKGVPISLLLVDISLNQGTRIIGQVYSGNRIEAVYIVRLRGDTNTSSALVSRLTGSP